VTLLTGKSREGVRTRAKGEAGHARAMALVPLLEWAGILKALPRLDPTRCFCKLQPFLANPTVDRNIHGDPPHLSCPRPITKAIAYQTSASIPRQEFYKQDGPCLRWLDNSGRPLFFINLLAPAVEQHLSRFSGMLNPVESSRCFSVVFIAPFLLPSRMRIILATSCHPHPSRFLGFNHVKTND
jgi:hypothetical protein